MRGRRYSRAEAQALLEAYADEALTKDAATLPAAIAKAEARLNRAARRALGARGDGRFHPYAAPKSVIRTRNAR